MQSPWQAPRKLHLWVLVWLLLATCAAVATPLAKPRALEVACSGSGHMVLLVDTADGPVDTAAAGLDCPLCLPADMPPPDVAHAVASLPVFREAAPRGPWHHPVHLSRHRPPARAPPFFH